MPGQPRSSRTTQGGHGAPLTHELTGIEPKRRQVDAPSFDPWIVTTSLTKPDPATRRSIRSHVMRGKNTRHDKRSKKLARLIADDGSDDGLQSATRHSAQTVYDPGDAGPLVLSSPRKIASELSMFGYRLEMQPYMLDLIYKTFTIIKPATFIVEETLVQDNFNGIFCFDAVAQSPAAIHSILFTSLAFRDMLLGTPHGPIAQLHLAKALYYLQRDLKDIATATTDTTMSVVILLAGTAAYSGDFELASKHMEGLYRILSLRGGVAALGEGTLGLYKAQKLDLGIALATGCKTRLFEDGHSDHAPSGNDLPVRDSARLHTIYPASNARLLSLWNELQEFSMEANEATKSGIKMPTEVFLQFVASVPGRLVNLQLDPFSIDELVRLCMLTYLKRVLVHFNAAGSKAVYLAGELKASLLAHDPTSYNLDRLLLWSLCISKVVIFGGPDEDWLDELLLQTISSSGLRTWSDFRAVLKEFLWIDIIFDTKGKELFDRFLGMTLAEHEYAA